MKYKIHYSIPYSVLLEEPCKLHTLLERRRTDSSPCLPCLVTIYFFTFLFLFLLLRGLGGIVCLSACVVVSRQLARVFKVHPHCGRVRISAAKASIHIHVFNTYNWHIWVYVYQTFVCSSTHWNKRGFFLWGMETIPLWTMVYKNLAESLFSLPSGP